MLYCPPNTETEICSPRSSRSQRKSFLPAVSYHQGSCCPPYCLADAIFRMRYQAIPLPHFPLISYTFPSATNGLKLRRSSGSNEMLAAIGLSLPGRAMRKILSVPHAHTSAQ